jgi:xanthine/CO dehydrogenase XdhC/CoxF family maturation factor
MVRLMSSKMSTVLAPIAYVWVAATAACQMPVGHRVGRSTPKNTASSIFAAIASVISGRSWAQMSKSLSSTRRSGTGTMTAISSALR